MASTRTTNLEIRVNQICALLSVFNDDNNAETLKIVFTGYGNEDRFPIVINGVKVFMTYNEVKNYNKKNKTNFELRYTKTGITIMNQNFDRMLKMAHNGYVSKDTIRELMKEADTYREFVLRKKKFS